MVSVTVVCVRECVELLIYNGIGRVFSMTVVCVRECVDIQWEK